MSAGSTVLRYWHTLRYLRPVQFYARARRTLVPARADSRPAPVRRATAGAWQACLRTPSMLGPERFRFIGAEHEVAGALAWNAPDRSRLWLYNLHYFDDLVADAAQSRAGWHRALLQRWIAENPPLQGSGWEPYPISLRTVNWIKWLLTGARPVPGMLGSLAVQVRALRRRLEYHLLGNHLWANLKALVFAGAFFDGGEAGRWRAEGLARLRREIATQVLADGGHFERSPMYHAIVLEDVLDLVQLASLYPGLFEHRDVAAWREVAGRMLRWLSVMTHPDGGIAFFNDATHGVAPRLEALAGYAERLGIDPGTARRDGDVVALEASGYVRLQAGPAVVIADVGEIGPDYLPGHAHADTLSFELSLGGVRLVVNGGISTYEPVPERQRQRGTGAHSTVQVDGQDSSEVWSSFRVARRARPSEVSFGQDGDVLRLHGAHDGYRRLRGRPLHRREWLLSRKGLLVRDRLEGESGPAVARFLLHPDWRCIADDAASGWIERPGARVRWSCVGAAGVQVAAGTWHPGFGRSLDCRVIEIAFGGGPLETRFDWE